MPASLAGAGKGDAFEAAGVLDVDRAFLPCTICTPWCPCRAYAVIGCSVVRGGFIGWKPFDRRATGRHDGEDTILSGRRAKQRRPADPSVGTHATNKPPWARPLAAQGGRRPDHTDYFYQLLLVALVYPWRQLFTLGLGKQGR